MFGRSRPEALERIVYCSRARIDTTSLQAIAEILGVSQRNNAREGLTGALAVNDGWFLQVVEGPGPAIDRLLRRLAADPRHAELEVLSRRSVSGRLFADWSMVAASAYGMIVLSQGIRLMDPTFSHYAMVSAHIGLGYVVDVALLVGVWERWLAGEPAAGPAAWAKAARLTAARRRKRGEACPS